MTISSPKAPKKAPSTSIRVIRLPSWTCPWCQTINEATRIHCFGCGSNSGYPRKGIED